MSGVVAALQDLLDYYTYKQLVISEGRHLGGVSEIAGCSINAFETDVHLRLGRRDKLPRKGSTSKSSLAEKTRTLAAVQTVRHVSVGVCHFRNPTSMQALQGRVMGGTTSRLFGAQRSGRVVSESSSQYHQLHWFLRTQKPATITVIQAYTTTCISSLGTWIVELVTGPPRAATNVSWRNCIVSNLPLIALPQCRYVVDGPLQRFPSRGVSCALPRVARYLDTSQRFTREPLP